MGRYDQRLGKRSIPLVLAWAIRKNGTCPVESGMTANPVVRYGACVSAHSYCVNASNDDPGYLCNCSKGYGGNPYVLGGCTDINECKLRKADPRYEQEYPCRGGTCRNVDGDYKCKCKFGLKGSGKSTEGCLPILSASAIISAGTIFGVSLLAVAVLFMHMERAKRKYRENFDRNGGQILKNMGIKIFTKDKLDKITNNYSSILGKGAFGEVYKGTDVENNQQVAVKRSITISEGRQADFANEISIQSRISHRGLVRLLGCCLETDVPMLVFEFIPNGSLYNMLHGAIRREFSLQVRLDVAMGSAEALNYMHSHASQKILHGDVKSSNILLGDKLVPKVSDFGISKLLSIEKKHDEIVIGDAGYIDPVYMKTGLLTEKSDVYSFGVVLLELITRKKAKYDGNNSLPINYVKCYKEESRRKEMYDSEILSGVQPQIMECLDMIGGIAVQCLKDVDERPTMTQVMEELKLVNLRLAKAKVKDNE